MGRIQTARLENFIRRWASIKGGGSVLSETLGEVFPVLDLENLTLENLLPAGWIPFWGFVTVIGVAAQLQGASLINPADSSHIIVVDHISVRQTTSSSFNIGTSLPLFTVVTDSRTRDTRSSAFVGGAIVGANANVGAAETGLNFVGTGGVDRIVRSRPRVAERCCGTGSWNPVSGGPGDGQY
ncbi:hypothetical protein LCGC14_2155620 [marine sediment metagenome]|uniref:Uncharacterized protein n=1 Tax=marine sediment metagenome TaxID=412755 RepID=A0A0F9G7C1_9ZZZZ